MRISKYVIAVGLLCAPQAGAAPITWATPQNISGAGDVPDSSEYDRVFVARSISDQSGLVVNDVTFDNAVPVHVDGSFGNNFFNQSGYNSGSTPYNTILTDAFYGSSTITLGLSPNGAAGTPLTIGQDYLVQVWAHDDRGNANTTILTSESNSVTLDNNITDKRGSGGQWVMGTFRADATTQTISVSGRPVPASATINAVAVYAIPDSAKFKGSRAGTMALDSPPRVTPGLADPQLYRLVVPGAELQLSESGELAGVTIGEKRHRMATGGGFRIMDCRVVGPVKARRVESGGMEFQKTLAHSSGQHHCTVIERILPNRESIRCEAEITGEGEPWSAPIGFRTSFAPTKETTFWTAWDLPPEDDLLTPAPLRHGRVYSYGSPRFAIEKPVMPWYAVGQRPYGLEFTSLPLLTWIDPDEFGMSLVASPETPQLDVEFSILPNGHMGVEWFRHRITNENPVRLAVDIVLHEPGWRGGLRWMTRRYRQFFDPPNPFVYALDGSGNYAQARPGNKDVDELKRMNLRLNWNAEFDWPYLGMFLPPVERNQPWRSFRGRTTSIEKMEEYAKWMRDQGFHVLQYFNATEFGTKVEISPQSPDGETHKPDWNIPNEFLFNHLGDAVVRVPEDLNLKSLWRKWPSNWEKTEPGGFYYTWEGAVVMDCGEPVYREYLLEQARRYVTETPSSSGICIDRLDWLRLYNLDRDDGVSWFDGAPARSLRWSWNRLMEDLAPILHGEGKVIFVNPLDKRLDVMRHVDGFFDEIPGIHGDALLCVRKPVLVFNSSPGTGAQADAFFQKCLYLGVHPMVPVAGNDHGIGQVSQEKRQPFLDYAPLLKAIRGKKWVLEPDCVQVEGEKTRGNMFEVPGGFVLPVVFGGEAKQAEVILNGIKEIGLNTPVSVLHPGTDGVTEIPVRDASGGVRLIVPLRRGCALVKVEIR